MKLWFEKGAWASGRGRRLAAALDHESVERVAVIRHAALGDMMVCRPFLVELRRFFPRARVTLSLVDHYTYGAPEDLVDRVHVVSGKLERKPLVARYREVRALAGEEILFDLAATNRSMWLCALNRQALRIGFPYRVIHRHLLYDVAVHRSDLRYEAEVLLEMLELLGAHTRRPLEFALPVDGEEPPTPYVVYFPGAATAEKRWPAGRFVALIEDMARRYPAIEHHVLEGVRGDEGIEEIVGALSARTNVRGRSRAPLPETIDYLGRARLVVAGDTGIRNLAIATGAPTVGIFFSTVPFRYWPRDPRHQVVFDAGGSPPEAGAVAVAAAGVLDTALARATSSQPSR